MEDIEYISNYTNLELNKLNTNDNVSIILNRIMDKFDVYKLIIEKLYQPLIIKPNTIGSLIYGCLNNNYGDVDKYCSPLCDNFIGCDNNVYLYMDKKLISKYINNNSNVAYIFTDDINIEFNDDDINTLYKDNIKYIQLVINKYNKHYFYNLPISINMFKIKSTYEYSNTINDDNINNNTIDKHEIVDNNLNSYIIIVIILLIIIFLLYFI